MAQVLPALFHAIDSTGAPLSGGKLHTYVAGTSTNKTTYSDPGLTSANANPVVLDSRGEAAIFGSGTYKLVLKDSDDVTIWTQDDIEVASASTLTSADGSVKLQCEETAGEEVMRFDVNSQEQMTLQDGKLEPTTNNDLDWGSATKQGKDAYFDGTANIDDIITDGIVIDERAAKPTTAANQMGVYAKVVDGQSEAFVSEESNGDEVQITDQGKPPLPRGHIAGLVLSIDAGPSPDINITAGQARDSADGANLILATETTKQLDAAWAAGDDAGGLFTGSMAADTWYHVFLIRKDSDGSIDVGFDTSVTAANIPAGYTEYRRIGSVLADGTPTNVLGFSQNGDEFLWDDPPLDADATVGTTSALQAISIPLGIKTDAIVNVHGNLAGSDWYLYISSPDADDEVASSSNPPLYTCGSVVAAESDNAGGIRIRSNTSSQLRARAANASTILRIVTLGYIDTRGKDA